MVESSGDKILRFITAVKNKGVKFAYDTKATLWTRLGWPLERRETHPHIVETICLRKATETAYDNRLEEKYYNVPANIRFFHPQVNLYVLKNIWVTGSEGHIFFEPNILFTACPSVDRTETRKIRRPITWLSEKIDKPVFILSSRAPGNRGHFLTEHLPRLIGCRNALEGRGAYKVLVTPGHKSWQVHYLKKLGINADDVVEASFGGVFCSKAYFVPVLCEGKQATISIERDYRIIRRAFLAGKKPSKRRTPIFLSRLDAPDRKLLNEDRVFEVAKNFFPSIKRISLSLLSLDEQIQIFQNASLVMGPHSQSFRNVLFCHNALVIQLLQGYREDGNEYYHWAKNYSCMGLMNANQCLTLFSNTPFYKNSDWEYPEEKFENDIRRLKKLIEDEGWGLE
jgi:hypothetical protein